MSTPKGLQVQRSPHERSTHLHLEMVGRRILGTCVATRLEQSWRCGLVHIRSSYPSLPPEDPLLFLPAEFLPQTCPWLAKGPAQRGPFQRTTCLLMCFIDLFAMYLKCKGKCIHHLLLSFFPASSPSSCFFGMLDTEPRPGAYYACTLPMSYTASPYFLLSCFLLPL